MLEAAMLICFGSSWPASIYKSYRLKRVTGKSKLFLWLVLIGYIFGILHKLFGNTDWVTLIYAMNGCMVFVDLCLYYRYEGRS